MVAGRGMAFSSGAPAAGELPAMCSQQRALLMAMAGLALGALTVSVVTLPNSTKPQELEDTAAEGFSEPDYFGMAPVEEDVTVTVQTKMSNHWSNVGGRTQWSSSPGGLAESLPLEGAEKTESYFGDVVEMEATQATLGETEKQAGVPSMVCALAWLMACVHRNLAILHAKSLTSGRREPSGTFTITWLTRATNSRRKQACGSRCVHPLAGDVH